MTARALMVLGTSWGLSECSKRKHRPAPFIGSGVTPILGRRLIGLAPSPMAHSATGSMTPPANIAFFTHRASAFHASSKPSLDFGLT